jgi:NTE family protein
MANLPLGVALSGGTAKSVAHVGVLKALAEANIPISYITGTSGGSMVAAMYASGMPVSSLESVATTMSWRKLVTIRLTRLGFISSQRIEEFVEELIGPLTFPELKVPCAIPATNLVTGERRIFMEGSVARAVRASCSIPQIYLPVEIEGEYYVDGGLSEYLPIDALRELGCAFTVASNLAPVDLRYRRPHHILHLVVQVTGLMARMNSVASVRKADVVVHTNLDEFSSFDFDHAERMIELAYETTMRALDDLRASWKRRSGFWGRLVGRIGGGVG